MEVLSPELLTWLCEQLHRKIPLKNLRSLKENSWFWCGDMYACTHMYTGTHMFNLEENAIQGERDVLRASTNSLKTFPSTDILTLKQNSYMKT